MCSKGLSVLTLILAVSGWLIFGCDRTPSPAPAVAPSTQPVIVTSETFRGQTFHIVRIDPKGAEFSLHWKTPAGERYRTLHRVRESLVANGRTFLFATNAGIFTQSREPLGLHIESNTTLVPLNRASGDGNFYLLPNGVFYIDETGPHIVPSSDFQSRDDIRIATQSGPMLVIAGQLHPAFREGSDNRFIRSGVGIAANQTVIFALSDRPVNFFDFASLFRDHLGCRDALYLDGAISRFLTDQSPPDHDSDFAGILAVTAVK